MSNIITTKVTKKTGKNGTTYLHEVFVDGVLLDKRKSVKTYSEALVVRRNRGSYLRTLNHFLADAKANAVKYANDPRNTYDYAPYIAELEAKIANAPEVLPLQIHAFSNVGKYTHLTTPEGNTVWDVVAHARF